ncbi:MAG: hypothetical protein N2171_02015 [Clostridia bacterium]|nr:hypothetical protein [Clostridia bacterium]
MIIVFHLWSLGSDSITNEPQPSDGIILHSSVVMKFLLSFTGTATELAEEFEKHSGEKLLPNVLMKKIIRCRQELAEIGISFTASRTRDRCEISFILI